MNRLRELRKKKGLTQDQVGEILGVQKAAVCKYETGQCPLSQDAIFELCKFFDVTSDYLLGRINPPSRTVSYAIDTYEIPITATIPVPVLGRIHAGLPMLATENIEEYIDVPKRGRNEDECFFLQVVGDCMTGDNIVEGSLVLIHKQADVPNGQIAAVRQGDEIVLRRIKRLGSELLLIPSNPTYEPMLAEKEDTEIIGKAIEVRIQL